MPTADLDRTPGDHVDLAMNCLLWAGLDLHRALTRLDTHDTDAARRIRAAMDRIDETMDELRQAVLRRE